MAQIKLLTRKMLKPAFPSPSPILQLSNIDLTMPCLHRPCLFLFDTDGTHYFMSSEVLESSLSRVLVEFYPLAGRLACGENGKWYVSCQDQGVEFTEATASGFEGVDLTQPCQEQQLLNPCHGRTFSFDMPIALFQLTRFDNGKVALVVAVHHRVCDGQSVSFFLYKWCSEARGVPSPMQASFEHPKLKATLSPALINYMFTSATFTPPGSLAWKLFEFDSSRVEAMRSKCSSKGNNVSRFIALATHTWQCVTKARHLDPMVKTKMAFTMCARKVFRPPLPEGYFGNVIVTPHASSTVEDLLSRPHLAASSIKDAISSVDENYVISRINEIETGKNISSPLPADFDAFATDLFVGTWASFHQLKHMRLFFSAFGGAATKTYSADYSGRRYYQTQGLNLQHQAS